MNTMESCYWYTKEVNDPPYCRLRQDYMDDNSQCDLCYMDVNAVDDIVRGLTNCMINKIYTLEKMRKR